MTVKAAFQRHIWFVVLWGVFVADEEELQHREGNSSGAKG